MCLEVVLELPGCHEDYIEELMNLQVPSLCVLQDLTDKVHRFLFSLCIGFWLLNGDNSADNCVSGCHI
jgi:hypothetical protein